MKELEHATDADPGAALALPFEAYRDPDVYEREMETMFRGDWVAVCSAASIAESGAYLALDIGGEPVVVLRGKDGELRALSNACRHRGTLLLDPGRGNVGSSIVCPYHAWAYDQTGALRGAPMTGNVTIDANAHALPAFALEVWAGVVFVNVDGRAGSLAERLAGLEEHLAPYGVERYDTPSGQLFAEDWDANWKFAYENGIESYHLFKLHRDTLERVAPTRGAYYLEGSGLWTVTGGTTQADPRPYPGEPPSLGERERGRYVLVSIPPSFIGTITRDSWSWGLVHPLSHGRTRFSAEGLIPAALASFTGGESGMGLTEAFLAEDREICERGQRGIQARHGSGGQLVELERVVGDFHRYLGMRLFGAQAGPRHREEPPEGERAA